MRCNDCVTEPLLPARYCECCGREVPDLSAPVTRCESCGGPAAESALCDPCHQAFSPLLDAGAPATAPDTDHAREEAEKAEAAAQEAARIEAATAEAARVDAARKTAAQVVADRAAAAAKRERDNLSREPRPVAVMPPVPTPSRSTNRPMLLGVAAVAILGAAGFSQRDLLLGMFGPVETVHQAQPAQRAAAVPFETLMMAAADAASPISAQMPAASSTQAAGRPKPARAQVQAPQIPAHAVTPAAVAAPAPVTVAPAPASERARSVEVPAATGKFFEPNDVDVSPQIARRIEPLLPADLKDRPINEVVIVRVLVSQSGDPSLVRLLRKSKHGPSLDEAVVAAVTQWRFSPAKRRGEAVSSWYNVGVPLGQTN